MEKGGRRNAATLEAQDLRRKSLIANLFDDFDRLLDEPANDSDSQVPPDPA